MGKLLFKDSKGFTLTKLSEIVRSTEHDEKFKSFNAPFSLMKFFVSEDSEALLIIDQQHSSPGTLVKHYADIGSYPDEYESLISGNIFFFNPETKENVIIVKTTQDSGSTHNELHEGLVKNILSEIIIDNDMRLEIWPIQYAQDMG
jgi:hypothetical protein